MGGAAAAGGRAVGDAALSPGSGHHGTATFVQSHPSSIPASSSMRQRAASGRSLRESFRFIVGLRIRAALGTIKPARGATNRAEMTHAICAMQKSRNPAAAACSCPQQARRAKSLEAQLSRSAQQVSKAHSGAAAGLLLTLGVPFP